MFSDVADAVAKSAMLMTKTKLRKLRKLTRIKEVIERYRKSQGQPLSQWRTHSEKTCASAESGNSRIKAAS